MYGIELMKGVSVLRVWENAGKKRVKDMRGSDIGEATVRTIRINGKPVEYFLCRGLRIFLDDLYTNAPPQCGNRALLGKEVS